MRADRISVFGGLDANGGTPGSSVAGGDDGLYTPGTYGGDGSVTQHSPSTDTYSYLHDDSLDGLGRSESLAAELRLRGGGVRAQKREKQAPGTPFPRAVALLMNAILGSGVLGQAYAARHAGIVPFLVLITAMAFAAEYGARLLLQCCEQVGVTAYEDVGHAAWSTRGRWIASTAIFLQNFGAISSCESGVLCETWGQHLRCEVLRACVQAVGRGECDLR